MNRDLRLQVGIALVVTGCSGDPSVNVDGSTGAESSSGSMATTTSASTSGPEETTDGSSGETITPGTSGPVSTGETTAGETTAAPCQQHDDCWMDAFAPICVDGTCVGCGDAESNLCGDIDPAKPLCADDGRCVACIDQSNNACPASAPACDTATNTCHLCETNDDCASGVCQSDTGECFPTDCIVDVAADGSGDTTSVMEGLADGCSVRLHAGDYDEVVTFDGSDGAIIAAGDGPANIVAHGEADPGASVIVQNGAHVYLQGIGILEWWHDAIHVDAASIALDRVRVTGSSSGQSGLVLTGGAEATVRTSFIMSGGNYGPIIAAVLVDGSSADILASSVRGFKDDLQTRRALTCVDPVTVTVRNSVLMMDTLAPTTFFEVECDEADVTYTATNKPVVGEGNVAFGDWSNTWFDSYDIHLATPPAGLLTTAVWRTGDPTVDIDGDPRPAVDDTPDVAGADVP